MQHVRLEFVHLEFSERLQNLQQIVEISLYVKRCMGWEKLDMKNMGLVMMMGLEKVEMKGIMVEVVADNREEKRLKMEWWC
jgi:hypothetical protein